MVPLVGRHAGSLLRCSTVELRRLCIERYKGYAQRVEVEFAPLTILVGPNNAGKTALAQSIQLLAGGLSPEGKDVSEPLPLESGGIHHGTKFADLVTGRSVHGWLNLSATFSDGTSELSLAATVRNVEVPPHPPVRQVSNWRLASDGEEIVLKRLGFDDRLGYQVFVSGTAHKNRQLLWRRLIPMQSSELVAWAGPRVVALQSWAAGVRHLQCPRRLIPSPFVTPDTPQDLIGPDGELSPLLLAANDELRESVRKWYRSAFATNIDAVAQGSYTVLVAGAPARSTSVPLTQSGRGLSQVLPVAVMSLTSQSAGPGVDIIEHPEAELHPAAHAHVAELLLENIAGPMRPLVIETHSEMILLRARRWVAEGRLPSHHVLIYWVSVDTGSGSAVRKIRINNKGELDCWPGGVFIEDYEEILAIRRAARTGG